MMTPTRVAIFLAMGILTSMVVLASAMPEPSCALCGDGDEAPAADVAFTAGPDGTVRLGNKACPVMGGKVGDNGVALNGWWIGICCPGCGGKIKADADGYATKLLAATGIDVRKSPASYIVRPNRHFEAGPHDTKRLANAHCPIMGGKANSEVGAAHNGWWINFCCAGCDAKLAADVDAAATKLLADTGVDIHKRPETYESKPNPAFESGPDGSVKLGNAACPVMGGAVKPGVGAVINGWWIGFCCPGCDTQLREKMAELAPRLRQETGIDIRQSPLGYMRRPAGHQAPPPDQGAAPDSRERHFVAGPHDTIKLGNKTCPVMNKPVNESRGVALNGWWIGICCGMCERKLADQVDTAAERLLKETVIDIRRTPDAQGVHLDSNGDK